MPGQTRRTSLGIPHLSLKGNHHSSAETKTAATTVSAPAAPLSEFFTDADVDRQWEAFIVGHDSLHLLANAMRMARPARKDPSKPLFTITHSSVQIGFIREYLREITDFIRREVRNDSVEFELIEIEEDSPLAWNDRELIRHIINDTPAVADFAKEFQLKLI